MKIMFWSKASGQCGVTSNMVLMAFLLGIANEDTSVIIQPNFQPIDVLSFFYPTLTEDYEESGLDALIRMIKSEHVTKEIVDNCMITINKSKLSILKASTHINRDMFEWSISHSLNYCINAVDQYYDYVFIDAGYGESREVFELLEEADLIVVNLNQNKQVIEEMMNVETLPNKRFFYLIGMYDHDSEYTVSYISNKYRIPSKQIGIIPYTIQFRDACSNGTLDYLYLKWMERKKGEEGGYFMLQVKMSLEKLLACLPQRREEF